MKKNSVGILVLALTVDACGRSPGQAVFDCTSRTDRHSTGVTLTQNYISHSGSVSCIQLSLGGTLNVNGHRITCEGTCSRQAIYVQPPLTSTATIENATIVGAWANGIESIDAYQQPVIVQANKITGLQNTAAAIFGGTQITGNAITSTDSSKGSAMIFSPVPISITALSNQYVEDNSLDLAGGYGIRVVPNHLFGDPVGQPDIAHNFISGAATYVSAELDRLTGKPSRVEVIYNTMVDPLSSSDPFPNEIGGDVIGDPSRPNTCDQALVALADTGRNPDVCN